MSSSKFGKYIYTYNSILTAVFFKKYERITDALNRINSGGYLFGVSFALVTNPAGGVAWDVAAFTVNADGTVLVNVHLYDFETGEDVLPDNPGVINCQLNEGGPDGEGTVYFYPYS